LGNDLEHRDSPLHHDGMSRYYFDGELFSLKYLLGNVALPEGFVHTFAGAKISLIREFTPAAWAKAKETDRYGSLTLRSQLACLRA